MRTNTTRHSTRYTTSLIAFALLAGTAVSSIARAAENEADLDVHKIILYRSGVGYFERAGSITGDQTVSLRFETGQVNDILKSMVLLDLDPEVGGNVQTISYGSKEPLARRLDSFDINISGAPDIASLFQQLRGEQVSVTTNQGITQGTILGVERRTAPMANGDSGDTFQRTFVNLVTETGIQSLTIDGILRFEFTDDDLNEQLNRALMALAEHRTDRLKTVDLAFTGPDDRARRVMLSYVHETPVWKTSYRLVLPEDDDEALTLQGWAIVENTTDHDWNDVRLSLASGRPVSFTMDLYEPVFAPRPELPVPVTGALAARTYETGRMQRGLSPADAPMSKIASNERRMRQEASEMVMDQLAVTAPGEGGAFAEDEVDADTFAGYRDYQNAAPTSAATGDDVGGQFMYTLDTPVTVERQRSAMIPIITAPIAGKRVSIYNPSDMPRHPMRGAQLVNDSALHLMPGPIAVYDTGAYAGDAQIPHTSRNQSRLLAYALDIDVIARTERDTISTTVNLKIVDGLLEETVKSQLTTSYMFDNHDSARGRDILIEHDRMPGWDLVRPEKPAETTDSLYRFEARVTAHNSSKFDVVQERVVHQRFAMTSYPLETLVAHATNGKASQAVVNAVREAAAMQSSINRLNEKVSRLDQERDQISRDQDRIRNNMSRIDRTSQLYGRYMAKLNEQETRLESIIVEREQTINQREQAQNELNQYLRDLDVE
jgi:hypothetical protein